MSNLFNENAATAFECENEIEPEMEDEPASPSPEGNDLLSETITSGTENASSGTGGQIVPIFNGVAKSLHRPTHDLIKSVICNLKQILQPCCPA